MAVAIVTRKSTRDEAKVSVTRQEAMGREWAASERPGVEVVVFSDNATSGTNMARPGWVGFTEALERGQISDVWAYEQSRLTRAGEVAWGDVCALLTAAGIDELHTGRQGRIGVGMGNRVVGGINSVLDQHEREVAIVRTRDGIRSAAEQGRPHGSTGYGYRRVYDDAGRPQLVPDPEQAPIVAEMVERVAEGWSLGAIAADLNDRGVPTSAGGCEWRRDAVRLIVSAPRVVGLRSHRGKIVGPALWPPIVDRTLWERAGHRLAQVRPGTTAGNRRSYLLTGGHALCDECGTPLIAGTTAVRGVRLPSYQCPHPSRSERGCGHCSILADRLEEHVDGKIKGWLDEKVVAYLNASNEPSDLQAIRDELDAVEADLASLAERLGSREILPFEHAAARRVLADRHRTLSETIAAAGNSSPPVTLEELRAAWVDGDVMKKRGVLHLALDEPIRVSRAHVAGRRLGTSDRVKVTLRTPGT